MIQIQSAEEPFNEPEVGRAAADLLGQADAMGLLESGPELRHLDWETILAAAEAIASAGIGVALARELQAARDRPVEALSSLLSRMVAVLEESPAPDTEWRRVADVLGRDELAARVGVSESSTRRYRAGDRETPDEVAARLHFIARIVFHLGGAYSPFGVRRWFHRKRTLLDGQTPAEILSGSWDPDDPEPQRVFGLARSLSGSPAT